MVQSILVYSSSLFDKANTSTSWGFLFLNFVLLTFVCLKNQQIACIRQVQFKVNFDKNSYALNFGCEQCFTLFLDTAAG